MQAAGSEQNGNGTEIHRWCAGDRMANGRVCVPFRRNGTERKRQRFYASYSISYKQLHEIEGLSRQYCKQGSRDKVHVKNGISLRM